MMWDGSHEMGWWMVLWMTLASVAWIGLVTFLVYSLTGGFGDSRRDAPETRPPETPLGIAQRRYASGELTEEEFERISNKMR